MRTNAPLLAPIFRSDGQARVLTQVLLNQEPQSISEIATHANMPYATVYAEVQRLLEASIFKQKKAGRSSLISANFENSIVEHIQQILIQTAGPKPLLQQALSNIEGIVEAFIYGSFAARSAGHRGEAPNDIDLMVVGNPDPAEVYAACSEIELQISLPINPTIMTETEFNGESGFLQSVRAKPVIHIIGRP